MWLRFAFIKANILRKIENDLLGGAICLWKVSKKCIHIYSNIIPPFLLPPSPPTPSSVKFMLRKIYVLFSSWWESLTLISLPSYFRPRPTVSCEKKKRLNRSSRIQRAFGEHGQGYSTVPTFHHRPLPSILAKNKVRLRIRSVGRITI